MKTNEQIEKKIEANRRIREDEMSENELMYRTGFQHALEWVRGQKKTELRVVDVPLPQEERLRRLRDDLARVTHGERNLQRAGNPDWHKQETMYRKRAVELQAEIAALEAEPPT